MAVSVILNNGRQTNKANKRIKGVMMVVRLLCVHYCCVCFVSLFFYCPDSQIIGWISFIHISLRGIKKKNEILWFVRARRLMTSIWNYKLMDGNKVKGRGGDIWNLEPTIFIKVGPAAYQKWTRRQCWEQSKYDSLYNTSQYREFLLCMYLFKKWKIITRLQWLKTMYDNRTADETNDSNRNQRVFRPLFFLSYAYTMDNPLLNSWLGLI